VKIAGQLPQDVRRVLAAIPGTEIVEEPSVTSDHRVDAIVTTSDRRYAIAIEARSRVNAATAHQLINRARQLGDMPLLVAAGQTTASARATLIEHGVAYVDAAGNAHVNMPGILIHVTADLQRPPTQRATPRLSGKASVVVQAILLDHDRPWKVTPLAETARVSTGLAHRVLARLEADGLMTTSGAGPGLVRRLIDASALLDLWVEEQQDRPQRTSAHLLAPSPTSAFNLLSERLDQSGLSYALTGPAAANLIAPFLSAVPVTQIWLASAHDAERACRAIDATPVSTGFNLVFMQEKQDTPLAFRQRVADRWITNAFRLYVDTRRTEQRGREQADHLRQTVIGF
jgi:hypothetical protein